MPDDAVSPDEPTGAAPAPAATEPVVRLHPHPPRPGDLSPGWRAVAAAIWLGVIIGLAAVWNASVQLGLSTWWLGPRADPQPQWVRFSPFIPPTLMLLAAINRVRWLGWIGLGAAALVAAVGVADLGRVPALGGIEVAIAGAAAAVSLASLTGTYRPGGRPADVETETVASDGVVSSTR